MTESKREDILRDSAKQLGLIARKRVPPFSNVLSGWMLIDKQTNAVVAGSENGKRYGLSLEQAEAIIADMREEIDG